MDTLKKLASQHIERKNIYSNKKWIEFSKEMRVELGNRCFKCNRDHSEAVLQLHHIVYENGKAPWESAREDLEILCKGCHARKHGILEPSDSWVLIDITDNGIPDYKCERQKNINENCNTEIRYEHTTYHPDVGYRIVGSTCIKHLTEEDQTISKESISEKNNYLKKLMRLKNNDDLPRGWKIKNITKKDKTKISMTTFDINKDTDSSNYKINAVIYHNESNKNSMAIKINDIQYFFINKKTKNRSKYMYGKEFDLRKVISIIEGIKKTGAQKRPYLENFYKEELREVLISFNYKMEK